MVAGAPTLLVALLVLLVDDDEPELAHGAKERGPRAHHHARRPGTHHVPLVQALTRRKARVEHGHRPAEAAAETPDRLGGERDLGHEHDGGATLGEHALDS